MNISDSPSPQGSSESVPWRLARRFLLTAAALVTLIAIFYTVENWRGQRAWENRRRQLESKGEVLDWAACIPAPVPDDQNFFKAPNMQEWFVKDSLRDLRASPAGNTLGAPLPFALPQRKGTNLVLAQVEVVPRNASPESPPPDAALHFEDPAAREQAAKLLGKAIGPCAIGARQCVLVAQPLNQFGPLHLALQTDTVPTLKELAAFFPNNPLTNLAMAYSQISYLQVEPAGSNTFRVSLKEPVYEAADYLAWTEPLTADFDQVRKALERPYARIDCDYEQPYAIGIPNFITIRNVVQLLSQRAQSYLLLGQPEAALHELALVHDLCRIMQAKPSGKPMTLVAAMIDVAVSGLYADTFEDGLRLHAWREPQLMAIERQLKETDLFTPVLEAFREERAGTSRTFETTSRRELLKLFNPDPMSKLALTWMPRGWFYQNMALGAELGQEVLGSMDQTNQLVLPGRLSESVHSVSSRSEHRSPYTFLVAVALPNFAKAVQTFARTQTKVNQAQIACALERYRLTQAQYPEMLDALVPHLSQKLPHDLIGGQPLKYRRTEGDGYLLYSVGWDEKDDGGAPGKSADDGDWVWELH